MSTSTETAFDALRGSLRRALFTLPVSAERLEGVLAEMTAAIAGWWPREPAGPSMTTSAETAGTAPDRVSNERFLAEPYVPAYVITAFEERYSAIFDFARDDHEWRNTWRYKHNGVQCKWEGWRDSYIALRSAPATDESRNTVLEEAAKAACDPEKTYGSSNGIDYLTANLAGRQDARRDVEALKGPPPMSNDPIEAVPVAWVVRLKYSDDHWSGGMLTDMLPHDASTYQIVGPLYSAATLAAKDAEIARLQERLEEAEREHNHECNLHDLTKARAATLGDKYNQWFERAEALSRELAEVKAENERLREGLKPFAAVAEHDIGDSETDDDLFRPMSTEHARAPLLKVGDFRRAAPSPVREGQSDGDH